MIDYDLYFVCYMLERLSRRLNLTCSELVDIMGVDGLQHHLSFAEVECGVNPLETEELWIKRYGFIQRNCNNEKVESDCEFLLPSALAMGLYHCFKIEALKNKNNLELTQAIIDYFGNPENATDGKEAYIRAERLHNLYLFAESGKKHELR